MRGFDFWTFWPSAPISLSPNAHVSYISWAAKLVMVDHPKKLYTEKYSKGYYFLSHQWVPQEVEYKSVWVDALVGCFCQLICLNFVHSLYFHSEYLQAKVEHFVWLNQTIWYFFNIAICCWILAITVRPRDSPPPRYRNTGTGSKYRYPVTWCQTRVV